MAHGIHVEISVGDPDTCQVAPKSQGVKSITSISRCPDPDADDQVIEEFTVTTEDSRIEVDGGTALPDEAIETVFTSGSREIYRFLRPSPQPCVCESIERYGCPVRDVTAVDGTLYVTFVATDHDTLQTVLESLAARYDKMNVCRLLRAAESSESERLTVVDVGTLTDRQKEVMATAHRAGYFEHPKEASAAEVAERLDIARSTFTEHLAAAQRNLLDELLG